METDHQGRLGLGHEFDAPFPLLLRFFGSDGRMYLSGRDGAEITLHQGDGRLGVDIPHNGNDGALGAVVGMEEPLGLGAGQILDIRLPADGGVAVGMGRKAGGNEGLPQLVLRVGVGGAAALLHHHGAFGIELAQHGVLHAVGLDGRPQLQFVCRQVDHVGSAVAAGEGVVADTAVFGVEFEEFILYDVLGRLCLQRRQLLLQPGYPGLVPLVAFGLLGDHSLGGLFDLVQ